MLLHDPFEYWAGSRPDAAFVTDADTSITFADGLARCRRLAHALVGHGVEPGARIAVLAGNVAELMIMYFAASMAGVVPVPLNPRLAPGEWEHIARDAGAVLLFATGDVVAGTRLADAPPAPGVMLRGPAGRGWRGLDPWLAAAPQGGGLPDVGDHDVALQVYTSGTTGRPKGAVFTHAAISAILQRWQLHGLRVAPGDRAYSSMPVCMAAGLLSTLNPLQNGAEIVLAPEFDAERVVRSLSEDGVACTAMAPTMVQRCLEVPGADERRYPSLRFIQYGAAAMPVNVLRQAMDVFGCDFYQGFGLTEASTVAMLSAHDHRVALAGDERLLGSVGRPQMGTRVRIVDEAGVEVAAGARGEICVRGDFVMKEYWRAPEATAVALVDGWLHTGDVGYLDEGVLFVVDRVKDMIVTGGYNVYPREVERVIESFVEVAQVAVVGVPSVRWGEEVKAVIKLVPGARLSADEVVARCGVELGRFKLPKSVEFVDSFAVNGNGKILKRELRDRYLHRPDGSPRTAAIASPGTR